MGVDAVMMVRNVPETTVTDEWLKEMSWLLCESIGAEHFSVGGYWRQYGPFGSIIRSGSKYRREGDEPPGKKGYGVEADPGECLLEVEVNGRYYGDGYERGPILIFCAIAEWLEQNIPGCVVLYGGDHDPGLEEFSADTRAQHRQHLYSKHGRDYFHYSDREIVPSREPKPPACSVCPGGKYRGQQYGAGGGYAAFSCAGCGDRVESLDCGKTWAPAKKHL